MKIKFENHFSLCVLAVVLRIWFSSTHLIQFENSSKNLRQCYVNMTHLIILTCMDALTLLLSFKLKFLQVLHIQQHVHCSIWYGFFHCTVNMALYLLHFYCDDKNWQKFLLITYIICLNLSMVPYHPFNHKWLCRLLCLK